MSTVTDNSTNKKQEPKQDSIIAGVDNILVIVPANVILNWEAEFHKWGSSMSDEGERDAVCPKLFALNNVAGNSKKRAAMLEQWHATKGGVLIIGYNLFRNLANGKYKNKAHCETFRKVCRAWAAELDCHSRTL